MYTRLQVPGHDTRNNDIQVVHEVGLHKNANSLTKHVIISRGVMVIGVGLINEVIQHQVQLVGLLGWVTVFGRVNRPGM